jgi:uncharacterized protein (DUF2235 family)
MKRIITCSDGTWNRPGDVDEDVQVKTNVEIMYNCIASTDSKGIAQVKIYDEGVGTGHGFRDRVLGGITGLGLDKNIKDAYTFVCLNYEAGDELYFFGFSRGAYTARSLAGFIYNCGVLKPQNIHLVDTVFGLYRDRNQYSTPTSDLMRSFRKQFCTHPLEGGSKELNDDLMPVKFIGVWDTVGSLGIPFSSMRLFSKNKYQFHDTKINSKVENAYHALSVDDRRKLFEPTLWEKTESVKKDPRHPQHQNMEQRWFAGVHSNVGGGYRDYTLSNIALDWLIDKSKEAGLAFDRIERPYYEVDPERNKDVLRDSYTLKYRLWPKTWRTVDIEHDIPAENRKRNEVIDDSVLKRIQTQKNYKPENILKVMSKFSQGKGQVK